MVEQQGEVIKEVETHMESTVVDLEQGNKDISRAIVSAKATRKVRRTWAVVKNAAAHLPTFLCLVFWLCIYIFRKNGHALLFSSLSLSSLRSLSGGSPLVTQA